MNEATEITIAVETEPATAVQDLVLNGLRVFNREHCDPPERQPLTLAARDRRGEVIGGLVASTEWDWLHVNLLWIGDAWRRQGIGRRLLRKAEQEAASRGCLHVYLDTFDFQARVFYEKEGYEVFGVQDGYPRGHRRFFLRKKIAETT